jgi:hypothetical protein
MNLNLFDSFPIAGGYVGVSILMLVFSEVGYQFGAHARTSQDKEAPELVRPSGGGLLAMLDFLSSPSHFLSLLISTILENRMFSKKRIQLARHTCELTCLISHTD